MYIFIQRNQFIIINNKMLQSSMQSEIELYETTIDDLQQLYKQYTNDISLNDPLNPFSRKDLKKQINNEILQIHEICKKYAKLLCYIQSPRIFLQKISKPIFQLTFFQKPQTNFNLNSYFYLYHELSITIKIKNVFMIYDFELLHKKTKSNEKLIFHFHHLNAHLQSPQYCYDQNHQLYLKEDIFLNLRIKCTKVFLQMKHRIDPHTQDMLKAHQFQSIILCVENQNKIIIGYTMINVQDIILALNGSRYQKEHMFIALNKIFKPVMKFQIQMECSLKAISPFIKDLKDNNFNNHQSPMKKKSISNKQKINSNGVYKKTLSPYKKHQQIHLAIIKDPTYFYIIDSIKMKLSIKINNQDNHVYFNKINNIQTRYAEIKQKKLEVKFSLKQNNIEGEVQLKASNQVYTFKVLPDTSFPQIQKVLYHPFQSTLLTHISNQFYFYKKNISLFKLNNNLNISNYITNSLTINSSIVDPIIVLNKSFTFHYSTVKQTVNSLKYTIDFHTDTAAQHLLIFLRKGSKCQVYYFKCTVSLPKYDIIKQIDIDKQFVFINIDAKEDETLYVRSCDQSLIWVVTPIIKNNKHIVVQINDKKIRSFNIVVDDQKRKSCFYRITHEKEIHKEQIIDVLQKIEWDVTFQ